MLFFTTTPTKPLEHYSVCIKGNYKTFTFISAHTKLGYLISAAC